MTTVNVLKAGRPLIEIVKLCYSADRPLLIIGSHGIGKSELVEASAKSMCIGYVCRDLSLMEPPDLIGLPEKNGTTTKYLPPDFLPTRGKGLLVFEELNRCERYMRAPCLQLLTARQLNDYRLPPGWLPVAAINPDDAGYEVSALDPAMTSRFVCVTVVADRGEWLSWAQQNDVHRAVMKYAESDTTVFDRPESNPRALKYASDVLLAAEQNGSDSQTVQVALTGILGPARAAALWKCMQGRASVLSAQEILRSYPRHQSRVQLWIKKGQLDLVKATLLQLEKYLQVKSNYDLAKSGAKQWSNCRKFLNDLPGDLQSQAEKFWREREYEFPLQSKRRSNKP